MKTNNVRLPNNEEKEFLNYITIYCASVIVETIIIYFLTFHSIEEGECIYLQDDFWNQKTVAEHNLMAKIFEIIYNRDYMINKLEGIVPSALVSAVLSAIAEGAYYIKTYKRK